MSHDSDLCVLHLGATSKLRITVTDTTGDGLTGTAWAVTVVPGGEPSDSGEFAPAIDVNEADPHRVLMRYLHTPATRGDADVYVRGTRGDEIDITHAGTITTR